MSEQIHILKMKVQWITDQARAEEFRRYAQALPGVTRVDVNIEKRLARIASTTPLIESEARTAILEKRDVRKAPDTCEVSAGRPSVGQLIGLFALVLLLGAIFSRTGLLKPSAALGASTSLGAAFLLGLFAASSSCVAVAGGLLLASARAFEERYGTKAGRMKPVLWFVTGRLASYAVLGGAIGAVGRIFAPSPLVTGMITLTAALYMLVMGFDMLHLAPRWMKRCIPSMPKALAYRIMNKEGSTHSAAPFLLGAATFFLPCGFTQALQLYVLGTGNVWLGASLLFVFALGTAPSLLALGWAARSLTGKLGQFFFRFAGALVIVLGLWNVQNGLTIAGYPLPLPRFSLPERVVAAARDDNSDQFVKTIDGEQVVDIDVSYAGFWPEQFTLRRGVPARFEVSGEAAGQGCLSVLQIPKLGIRELLKPNIKNKIAFVPEKPGNYIFSCSMGMFRGSFTVIDS